MSTSDDIPVSSGGDEDVRPGSSVLHGGDFVAGHGSLKGVDGVDLGDQHASTVGLEGFGALLRALSAVHPASRSNECTYALSNITETGDDGDLSSKHDIGSTLDAIDERLATAVVVICEG